MKITVVCREAEGSYQEDILLYLVEVANPNDQEEIARVLTQERANDIGYEVEMEPLFAFSGDLNPIADWRG